MELLSLNEVRLIMLLQQMNNFDDSWTTIQTKSWSLNEMEELKGLHSMDFREENWPKIEILELTTKIQE